MLKDCTIFNGYTTNDIQMAKRFYADVLGLNVVENEMGVLEIKAAGNNSFIIYPKENHQSATFTVLNFEVKDIVKEVDTLISKGITFEQYGEPIQTDAKGICWPPNDKDRPTMAWFKDPAGNILSLMQEYK